MHWPRPARRVCRHMVLLSAICVQKPLLAFQQAKLAFEQALVDSGLRVLHRAADGVLQVAVGPGGERVKQGKPFLVFGDGTLTACKPISDGDLGRLHRRLPGPMHQPPRSQMLPIGGPGEAITPRQQGEQLFSAAGPAAASSSQVPVALAGHAIVGVLGTVPAMPAAGRWRAKAELARIGRYYATESMLVLDPASGRYSAQATPSTGSQTLHGFYADLLAGRTQMDRGDHAVF